MKKNQKIRLRELKSKYFNRYVLFPMLEKSSKIYPFNLKDLQEASDQLLRYNNDML